VRYKRAVDPGCGVRGCVGLRGPVVAVAESGFLRGPLRIRFCVARCVILFACRDRVYFQNL
jgi:hypothetical protein